MKTLTTFGFSKEELKKLNMKHIKAGSEIDNDDLPWNPIHGNQEEPNPNTGSPTCSN